MTMDWLMRALKSRTIRRLVLDALHLLAHRSPLVDALLERDPDRAFELAVKAAAKRAGIAIDATAVRLAVAEIIFARTRQQLDAENRRHLDEMLRLEAP